MTRRYRKPRCRKGQRHIWTLGAALLADGSGQLSSIPKRAHLRGQCKRCHKQRVFHPYSSKRPRAILGMWGRVGALAGKEFVEFTAERTGVKAVAA